MENLDLALSISTIQDRPIPSLNDGIRDITLSKGAKHPVETLQRTGILKAEHMRLKRLSQQFGGHSTLKIQIENEVLASSRRLPGLPSSLLSLQIHMGMNDTLQFEELFSDFDKPEYPSQEIHDLIEATLHIKTS